MTWGKGVPPTTQQGCLTDAEAVLAGLRAAGLSIVRTPEIAAPSAAANGIDGTGRSARASVKLAGAGTFSGHTTRTRRPT
ncbi:MAG: hypothetical protein ACREUU_17705 [Gammaproteobacteria bacterium]